jgi:hypothetical protein
VPVCRRDAIAAKSADRRVNEKAASVIIDGYGIFASAATFTLA